MLDAFGQTNTETKQITSYVADSIGPGYASMYNCARPWKCRRAFEGRDVGVRHRQNEQERSSSGRMRPNDRYCVSDKRSTQYLLSLGWHTRSGLDAQLHQLGILRRYVVKTLLCQFHAQRYVQRMISGKKHFVSPSLRDEIERLFSEMMYVPTKEQVECFRATREINFVGVCQVFLP
ncbi:hypothetical protein JG687_00018538 [Phytophthora cactorum]|uniref:Uncharacterized protein n=1 Tax=Phytophthora cactorum TaxID=29920 RepID=A0A8T1TKQ9_9STRA|nr:hypothetical protein JG687_00018538 [Phytophthora cactorum]